MTIKDIINYLKCSHYNVKQKNGLSYAEIVFEYEGKQLVLDKYYELDNKDVLHIDLKEIN